MSGSIVRFSSENPTRHVRSHPVFDSAAWKTNAIGIGWMFSDFDIIRAFDYLVMSR